MSLFAELEHIVVEQEPLGPKTWLRIGGPAEYYAEPTTVEELQSLVRRAREAELPTRLLGGGSNVVIPDNGLPGLVISLNAPAFGQLHIEGERIIAGGGVRMTHLLATAAREGLAGLEALAGIPGTVGGALHGNAGTANADIGQWTQAARVLTRAGELLERPRCEIHFGYRSSSLNELAILEGTFELEQDDPVAVTRRLQKTWITRRARQPKGDLPCVTVFKGERGVDPGELLDQAGLRRASVGRAEVSDEHPNFILAHPGCTADDVVRLVELMRSQVHERLGVELEPQVEIW